MVVPPLLKLGAIASMLCGKPKVGWVSVPSRASSVAVRFTSTARTLSSSCESLRAPMMTEDTARCARTQAGMTRLVELAELLQCAVLSTQPNTAPPITAGLMNFPNRHPLNQTLRSGAAISFVKCGRLRRVGGAVDDGVFGHVRRVARSIGIGDPDS